jgi:hypothetical protein
VPDALEARLLELVGIRPCRARPARAAITFVPEPAAVVGIVPKGARVAGPGPDGEPVVFETTADLAPIGSELAAVQTYDGARFRDVTDLFRDPAQSFRPFGSVPAAGAALYLGFEPKPPAAGPVFLEEIRFRLFRPAGAESPPVVLGAEGGLPPPVPPARFAVEACEDAVSGRFRAVDLRRDDTAAFTKEGHIVAAGPRFSHPRPIGLIEDPLHWLRFRLTAADYPAGRAPEIDALVPNTVEAVALRSVLDEFVGASDGRPDQGFALRHAPVEPDSLVLEVVVGEDAQLWEPIEDLLLADADAAVFMPDWGTGWITFGDGAHGRIPVAGAEIRAIRYRHGGGAATNLAAGAIVQPLTGLRGIREVTNRRPAVGGADPETPESLRKSAGHRLRVARDGAVTAADYEQRAMAFPEVRTAKALPLFHPAFPGVDVPGALTVVVVPEGQERRPVPSEDLLRAVGAWLDAVRTVGTELAVTGPELVEIAVRARLEVTASANFAAVLDRARRRLDAFLDARGWELGRDLQPSRLYAVLLDDPEGAVEAVSWLAVTVEGSDWERLSAAVPLPRNGLVYPGAHELVAMPAVDL